MRGAVRLAGDHADARAIGREAVAVLEDAEDPRRLFAELRDLNERRGRMLAESAQRPANPVPADASTPSPSRAYVALWGTLAIVGMVSALVLAVMFAAPDRKNAFADPALSAWVAAVAAVIAIPALLLVVLLRPPHREGARVGEVGAVLVGIMVLWSLGYRLVLGVDDGRGFRPEDLRWWIPAAGVTAVLLAGVVWRCDPVRRGGAPRAGRLAASSGPREDVVRELRRTAERIAARNTTAETRVLWAARLDAAESRGIGPDAVAQARSMTPASWLAWLCYDGDIAISDVVPR